jgi:Cu(I)/Ag(I) efflux system membrane fusion protein
MSIHDEAGRPESESVSSPFGARASASRRTLWTVLGAAGLIALAAAAYLGSRRAPKAGTTEGHNHAAAPAADSAMPVMLGPEAQHRIGVTFAQVALAPLERQVRTVGQLTYDETRVRRVVPRVDGYIETLLVNFVGQQVRVGDPLFTIYSPMLVTGQRDLLLARHLKSEVVDGTPDAVEGAVGLEQSARRRLANWDMPPDAIEEVLRTGEVQHTVTLRSPATGVVVEMPVLAGQRIMAGEVAYQLADLSRVWLEGEVFEQDLPAVHVGQLVTAEFTALPGEKREGRITYIYPTLNLDTRTAKVRVELANPGLRLKPGMYATFQFTAATPAVLSVPRSAVLVTGKRSLAFVSDGAGTLTPREVTTGRTSDDRVEILSGLSAGETVVASATFLVDAESNLGSALGGMANMPGMDITTPPQRPGQKGPPPATPATTDSMADMPGMEGMPGMPAHPAPADSMANMPGMGHAMPQHQGPQR